MTMSGRGAASPQPYGSGHEPANLGDILERVLDKGIVIAGDIQINLLDIELLTIKLRLVIASLETAKAVGIDWWEHDPWLSGSSRDLELENRALRERLDALDAGESVPAVESRRQELPEQGTARQTAEDERDG
ncbi:gas vesicle protein [Rhodococcus maanshanensis]|uniref:Gas vesicle protein n=1 Tax=Rhodococcus maanshanensis TaxID=183556 RepID=A0A1H7LRF6_9NOCA|nr:gas vesicle protein [Rhodococcus maanshanensis]SEL01534.1 Gas vesicle protein [Rhodococcus maanshanensis]